MKGWTGQSIEALRARGLTVTVQGGNDNQRGLPGVVQPPPAVKRASKYNAKKTERHGRVYDSIAEADRADQLLLLARAKVIFGLGFQPVFALAAAEGVRACKYKADFCYTENGRTIVEDVKSPATLTPVSRLKLKLFLAQYPDHELRLVDGKGNPMKFNHRLAKEAA